MRNKAVSLIALVVIVLAGLGVIGYLSIHKIDSTQFLFGFATIAGPTLAILYNNFKTNEIANKVDDAAEKINKIEQQTNGNLTAKLEAIPLKVAEEVKKNAD